MRTNLQTAAKGARLVAFAGLALILATLPDMAVGREKAESLCPNAPFSGCEPNDQAPLPDTSLVAELDRETQAVAAAYRPAFTQTGKASWYGPEFHGRKTASGERFDQHALTAAHRTLPLGTEVKVTNLETGRTVQVEINDRGPYIDGRIIDLSKRAAAVLGMEEAGVVPVKIETVKGKRPTEKAVANKDKGRDVEVAEQPGQR